MRGRVTANPTAPIKPRRESCIPGPIESAEI
jgi:hypothetical protein